MRFQCPTGAIAGQVCQGRHGAYLAPRQSHRLRLADMQCKDMYPTTTAKIRRPLWERIHSAIFALAVGAGSSRDLWPFCGSGFTPRSLAFLWERVHPAIFPRSLRQPSPRRRRHPQSLSQHSHPPHRRDRQPSRDTRAPPPITTAPRRPINDRRRPTRQPARHHRKTAKRSASTEFQSPMSEFRSTETAAASPDNRAVRGAHPRSAHR